MPALQRALRLATRLTPVILGVALLSSSGRNRGSSDNRAGSATLTTANGSAPIDTGQSLRLERGWFRRRTPREIASQIHARFRALDTRVMITGASNHDLSLNDDSQWLIDCPAGTCAYPVDGSEAILLAPPWIATHSGPNTYTKPKIVAYVQFPDGGTFAPLGFNVASGQARYLIRLLRQGATWRAWVIAPDGRDSTELVAKYSKVNKDLPAVARWEWDEASHTQLLGVRCGKQGWCTMGPMNGAWNVPQPGCLASDPDECRYKGWGDTQRLGEPSGTELLATDNVGLVYPEVGLDQWELGETWLRGATKTVAYLKFAKKYKGKYEDATKAVYALRLTYVGLSGTDEQFSGSLVPLDPVTHQPTSGATIDLANVRWETGLSSEPPPVARWYWNPTDEGVWVRCGYGCCMVSLS